jgi:hypothetical protein
MSNRRSYLRKCEIVCYYLPFIVLFISFFSKIFFFTNHNVEYWEDEVAVLEVSKVPMPDLINVVRTESHPLGFFLFLDIFSQMRHIDLKISVTILSYTIILLGLLYLYSRKPTLASNLASGLSIFISSFAFLLFTSDVRPEIIALPVLIVFFILLLEMLFDYHEQKVVKNSQIWKLHVLLLILLLFGNYLYYAMCFAVIICLSICFYKYRGVKVALFIHLLLGSIYFWLIMHHQMYAATYQFNWLDNFYNNALRTVSFNLIGNNLVNWWSDLLIILYMLGIWFGLRNVVDSKQPYQIGFIVTAVVVLVFSFSFQLFSSQRYTVPLFLVGSLLAGFAAKRIIEEKLIFILLIISITFFNLSLYANRKTINDLTTIVNKMTNYASSSMFGYIDEFYSNFAEYPSVLPRGFSEAAIKLVPAKQGIPCASSAG